MEGRRIRLSEKQREALLWFGGLTATLMIFASLDFSWAAWVWNASPIATSLLVIAAAASGLVVLFSKTPEESLAERKASNLTLKSYFGECALAFLGGVAIELVGVLVVVGITVLWLNLTLPNWFFVLAIGGPAFIALLHVERTGSFALGMLAGFFIGYNLGWWSVDMDAGIQRAVLVAIFVWGTIWFVSHIRFVTNVWRVNGWNGREPRVVHPRPPQASQGRVRRPAH